MCGGDSDGRKIDWEEVTKHMDGVTRKQCYHRWYCYLDPALDKYNRETYWTIEEVCLNIGNNFIIVCCIVVGLDFLSALLFSLMYR